MKKVGSTYKIQSGETVSVFVACFGCTPSQVGGATAPDPTLHRDVETNGTLLSFTRAGQAGELTTLTLNVAFLPGDAVNAKFVILLSGDEGDDVYSGGFVKRKGAPAPTVPIVKAFDFQIA